jgi:integrase
MALKDLEIKYAARRAREYKLFDGEGLYLLVKPSGSKLWRYKYRFNGKERVLCIGPYPALSAAAARQKRREALHMLDGGIDPAAAKKRNRARNVEAKVPATLNLFEPIARAWHANRVSELDPAHAERVISRLERDVFPSLGARDISSITPPEVLAVVRAVEARGALDVSRRVKQGISQIFRFAIASGWATSDPASSLNDALKPKPRVKHMARVPQKELPDLVRAIHAYDGEESLRRRNVTRDALLFTLLTWARTSEARFATFDEFEDLNGPEPLWRLSAERMKMEREHLVPLSQELVELIWRRRRETNGEFLFPGDKIGKPISENTMIYALYRLGYRSRQTVHGFRGLASTWANEAERYKADWIEMALAHEDENEVRGAYNSALYLTPRRRMLQDWSQVIAGTRRTEAEVSQAPQREPRLRSRAARQSIRPVSDRIPYWQATGRSHPR